MENIRQLFSHLYTLSKNNFMKKLISKALHEAQEDAAIGQSWNLHSEAACDQLAEKVADKLDSQIHHLPSKKVFVRVDVNGSNAYTVILIQDGVSNVIKINGGSDSIITITQSD